MTSANERRKWLAGGIALLLVAVLLYLPAHHLRTVWLRSNSGTAHASHARVAAPAQRAFALTDRFGDGIPDFLRLSDPADQAAFRRWFTSIAEFQAVRPREEVPAEINDCASLLRYAYREALKRHDDTWFVATRMEVAALAGEIRAWRYPETPLGAALFRVAPGSFTAEDLHNGSFAQFADARTLLERNAFCIGREVGLARAGDLLFFRQFGQSSPWHSMIVVSPGAQGRVVYHTGPDHGQPGELRRVPLAELLDHLQTQWRPLAANPNFLGVYRWTILRGNS
jgi:hypothetical protein